MGMKILDFVMCLIEQGMCFLFLDSLCEKRYRKHVLFAGVVIVSSVVLFICSGISIAIRPVLSIVQVMILSAILYKDKFCIRLAYYIMILYVYAIIDVIFGNFVVIAFDEQFTFTLYSSPLYRALYCIIVKAVNVLVILLIYRGWKKIKNDVSFRFWVLYNVVMLVFLLVTTVFIVVYSEMEQTERSSALFLIVSSSFFAMSMVVIYFFTEICCGFQRDKKLYILETGYSTLQEKMALQNQNTEKFKKIQHDMKKHLLNAATLIENQNYDTAVELLKSAGVEIAKPLGAGNTESGNDIFDAIIASKSALCESRKIEFKVKTERLDNIQIDVLDMSSLLSNVLDNAIEAAGRTDNPFVKLSVFQYNAYLAVCVKNSYIGNRVLARTSNCPASTKNNSASHGFGSRIIKDIALKYEGEATWEANGSWFTTVVLIKV